MVAPALQPLPHSHPAQPVIIGSEHYDATEDPQPPGRRSRAAEGPRNTDIDEQKDVENRSNQKRTAHELPECTTMTIHNSSRSQRRYQQQFQHSAGAVFAQTT